MKNGNILPSLDCSISGARLRELREESKHTQKDVADMLGVTVKTYRTWEKGESPAAVDSLFMLASFYGVSVDYILGRSDFRAVDGAAVSEITGLSDKAIQTLYYNGPYIAAVYGEEALRTVPFTVSMLLEDYSQNKENSVLRRICHYVTTKDGETFPVDRGRLSPFFLQSAFDAGAVFMLAINEAITRMRDSLK